MNHCRTCKHWDDSATGGADSAGRFWGNCDLATFERGEPVHAETLAFAQDGELYGADLMTADAFGCVQWEARARRETGKGYGSIRAATADPCQEKSPIAHDHQFITREGDDE